MKTFSGERLPSRPSRRAAALLLASLALTALIAMGLASVRFEPGMPLPAFSNGELSVPAQRGAPVQMTMSRLALIVVLLVIGVCCVVVIVRALWGVPWTRLLSGFWSLLWKVLLVAGALLAVASLLPRSGATSSEAPPPPPAPPPATAPLGAVPPAVLWAAGIGVAAIVVVLALRLALARRSSDDRSWEQEVILARQALLDGQDLKGVIIRCYARMVEALQEERGIERESFMTTGEFEALLEATGLPKEPVRALTRLFETARYSPWEPSAGAEQGAIRCLDAILEHVHAATTEQQP